MTDSLSPPARVHTLRLIIVEDAPDDVALLLIALHRSGYAPDYSVVQTGEELEQALRSGHWQLVLSDYTLPQFSGLAALQQVRAFDPDMPFIIVSGNIGEDVAVATMKAGAHDYLIKGNLTRLGAAIERELREADNRRTRRRDEQALDETTQQLQRLSSRMLDVQEAERRHIARELHDEIGQTLTALKLNMEALSQQLDGHPARPSANEMVAIAGELLDRVRRLTLDLRPPQLDDLGLHAALNWLTKRHGAGAGPEIRLTAPDRLPRFAPETETACFRIAQEAITNVIRHAVATVAIIELSVTEDRLCLEVRDDGCGFDLAAARRRALQGVSLGLVSMHERATLVGGRFALTSSAAHGTSVRASFPLSRSGTDAER